MLPPISSILNPPDPSRTNYQSQYMHQLPKLIPPRAYGNPIPSTAYPMLATPMFGYTAFPGPAEILSLPDAMMPANINPTAGPSAYYRSQRTEADSRLFCVPRHHGYQPLYPGNRAYSGDHRINTAAADSNRAVMAFNPTYITTNLTGTGYPPTLPLGHSTPDCASNAAAIRNQFGTHLPSGNPEHDARVKSIPSPRKQNAQNGADGKTIHHESQHSKEQSRSIRRTSHPPSYANGQPSSTPSTHPESDNSSPESDNSSSDSFPVPQTEEETGTPTPVPVFSTERLFPSRAELELRKMHFLNNPNTPTDSIPSSKKRSRSYDSSSNEGNGKESAGPDADSNSVEELSKRVKITKSSQHPEELLMNLANSSPLQCDSSPGSDRSPVRGIQSHSSPPGPSEQSLGERRSQTVPSMSSKSSPYSQEHGSLLRSDSARSNADSDRKKSSNRSSFSASELTSKNRELSEIYRGEAELNNIPPSQITMKVNHTMDRLIMKANMVKNTYRCDQCNGTFANEDSIVRHKRAQHTVATRVSQMVKCPECSLQLRNKQNLKRHLATHGPNAKHKCKECTAKFVTERARTTHMRNVHGEKVEQRSVRNRSTRCPVNGCTYASNQKTNVKRHFENKHLNIKRFRCTLPECDYVGSTRANRQAHMKIHQSGTEKLQPGYGQGQKET